MGAPPRVWTPTQDPPRPRLIGAPPARAMTPQGPAPPASGALSQACGVTPTPASPTLWQWRPARPRDDATHQSRAPAFAGLPGLVG